MSSRNYFVQNPHNCGFFRYDRDHTFGVKRIVADTEDVLCIRQQMKSIWHQGNNTFIYCEPATRQYLEEYLREIYPTSVCVLYNLKRNKFYFVSSQHAANSISTAYELLARMLADDVLVSHFCDTDPYYLFVDNKIYLAEVAHYYRREKAECPCCILRGNNGARGIVGNGAPETKWEVTAFLNTIKPNSQLVD